MADYLKDKQYYIDLYDLYTIKTCLKEIDLWRDVYKECLKAEELKHLSEEEKKRNFNLLLDRHMFVVTGERYRDKEETIRKWIDNDTAEQSKYDNTPEPGGIHCSDCNTFMHCTYKHLENYMNEPLRVLFFFECPNCKKRKNIYENGEEDIPKPELCPKCNKEVASKHTREGNIITWITACPSCGFEKTDIDDFDKKAAERKQREQEEKELMEKYRRAFCLSDEKGKEYIELIEKLKYAEIAKEEEIKKYDNAYYPNSLKLKKVTTVDLEKLLTEPLEKERFIKLSFDKPEAGMQLIIPFSVQDADSSRSENISTSTLEKLIKKLLENTNWRLMSEGVHYRLGYLSGRLKGHDREEDILELAGKQREPQQPFRTGLGETSKYEWDPIIQLAKLSGKHIGIENVRKRRLKDEPEGFFLEVSEGPYTCGVCHESTPGNKTWWNLDGLRCADCWRNIKEGLIPPLTWDHDNKVWIKDWQIKSDYSIHPGTRRKLEREGILRGRYLKRVDGTTYCTVYLVEENKDFFKKYPKKPEMKIEFTWSNEHKGLIVNAKKNDYSDKSVDENVEKSKP